MIYRINDKSWRVEKLYGEEWKPVFYCGTEVAARECLRRCLEREEEWKKLTPEQQTRLILRSLNGGYL